MTLPGTLVLGAVTLYVLALLGTVDKQLAEIARSRELPLAIGRAEAREFDQWIGTTEAQLASCASAPCHGPLARWRRS